MENIKIREASEEDFGAIVELFREFALFENLPEMMTNSVELMKREREYFNCFVAVNSANEIIGYATWFFAYFTWSGKALYMDDLYVKENYRGAGIGTMLIRKIADFATKSDCHLMRWQVSDWNAPAIGFYKSLGAVINNVERNCDLKLL